MRWLRAEQGGGVRRVAADHVAIDDRGNLLARNDRVRRVPARPQQATLLGAVPDEQRRAPGGVLHESASDGEHGHARRGVVVGAVPDGVAIHGVANAVVVLVATVEDHFIPQLGVGAAHTADDVHRGVGVAVDAQVGGQSRTRSAYRRVTGAAHDEHRRNGARAGGRSRRVEAVGAAHRHRREVIEDLVGVRVGNEDHRRRTSRDERLRLACRTRRAVAILLERTPAVGIDGHKRGHHGASLKAVGGARAIGIGEGQVHRRFVRRAHDHVSPEGERAIADRHAARRRLLNAAHRPPLKPAAVESRRFEPRLPRRLGDPHRRAHLVDRPGLAAAHLVAGHCLEVARDLVALDGSEASGERRLLLCDKWCGDEQGEKQGASMHANGLRGREVRNHLMNDGDVRSSAE